VSGAGFQMSGVLRGQNPGDAFLYDPAHLTPETWYSAPET